MRQRRDKIESRPSPAPSPALPAILRASYDEAMATNEAEWHATQEPLALCEAIQRAGLYGQPLPTWAEETVVKFIAASRTPNQARRHRESVLSKIRYDTVCALKKSGLTWVAAYEQAVEILKGTPAKAEYDTMKGDYAKVKKGLRAGKYYTIKSPLLAPKCDG